MEKSASSLQRSLAFSGALLFALGLFTGIWTGAAVGGTIPVKIPHLALAAHLNALLGGFWLLGVSYTFPFLGYGEKQLRRLSVLSIVPAWGNWLITLVASFLGVNGLGYTQDMTNNIVAALLQIFVVLPALVVGIYWARGFCTHRV